MYKESTSMEIMDDTITQADSHPRCEKWHPDPCSNEIKYPWNISVLLGGKDLGFKVSFKEIVLPATQDSGPDSQESQPGAESLRQLHSLIMCLCTACLQGGRESLFPNVPSWGSMIQKWTERQDAGVLFLAQPCTFSKIHPSPPPHPHRVNMEGLGK